MHNAVEKFKKAMKGNYRGDPGAKTRFDPVNSGSHGAAFHHEGRFPARGGLSLYLSESVLKPETCNVPPAVFCEMPF